MALQECVYPITESFFVEVIDKVLSPPLALKVIEGGLTKNTYTSSFLPS